MVDYKTLFSPDASIRHQASLEYSQHHFDPFAHWPRGCWGAANGWLMLCGPSPGRADNAEQAATGGVERPRDVPVYVGKGAGRIDFQSNKARTRRWRDLVFAVFGDEIKADCLTSVTNLDWGRYGNYKDISEFHLREGCATVFEVMQASKPRVVITLVTVTWEHLLDFLVEFLSDPSLNKQNMAGHPLLQCRILQLPTCTYPTLLLKSPQHPSRHFFTKAHCEQIAVTVRWFLEIYKSDIS